MKHPLKDEELRAYSGEHLLHELSVFWELADKLPDCEQGTTEYIALIESFAIHLRNLIEFFFFPEKGEYVRAKHFFETSAAWPLKLTPEFEKLLERANNEVSHLTLKRVSGNPPRKKWYIDQIVQQIEPIANEFGAKADAKKLHPKVREFLNKPCGEKLLWLADNVEHTDNVASEVLTSTSKLSDLIGIRGSSASTQTRLTFMPVVLPPKDRGKP